VRIKNITIQGFRGFNEECPIDFHERLTLFYAPNSYGKTSISEALEWLLYGITSKTEKADSKEEYRGSYRNCHLPASLTPLVKVVLMEGASEIELKGELGEGDSIKRFVNGSEVEKWPFTPDLSQIPKPFILQHALKYLLHVKPDQRFQGFARLLGLEELDQIHRDVISLCTKADAAIPFEVKQLLTKIDALKARLDSQTSLISISKSFQKGSKKLPEIYEVIMAECRRRVLKDTGDESIIPQLLRIREDAVGKIFKGRINLPDYKLNEKQDISAEDKFFLSYITNQFVKEYVGLVTLATVQHITRRADFLALGIELLGRKPAKCPFCGQSIGDVLLQHIFDEHASLIREGGRNAELTRQRDEVLSSLRQLRNRLNAYQNRHIGKALSLLATEPNLGKLKTILVPQHQVHFDAVESAIARLAPVQQQLESLFTVAMSALQKVETSITESKEDVALLSVFGEALVDYVAKARSFAQLISDNASAVSDADQILKH